MDRSKSTRHADFEWATQLNRFILSSIGIWPCAHESAYGKLLADLRATIAFILIAFLAVVPSLHSLIRTWGDMMSTIDNLQFTLPITTATIKLVIVWWKKADLTLAINMIAEDWLKIKTNKELRVMIKRAQYARILAIIGYAFMVLGMCLLMFLPVFGITVRYTTNITDPDKLLPLQTHYLYNKNRSPNFELTFAAQIIVAFVGAASYSGVDTLFGLLAFHLCGQMENLREKMINMREFKTFNYGLAIIVKDHVRLIRCFNIIESTYNLLLLGLLVYFIALFCLFGFLVTEILTEGKEMSFFRFLYVMSTTINVCSHMCLFCAIGEILVSSCADIHYAAYENEWYQLHPGEAKSLILIMIRASKPFYITAGKMFPMTMSMFCNLIKTSAGYISVLIAMQGSNK